MIYGINHRVGARGGEFLKLGEVLSSWTRGAGQQGAEDKGQEDNGQGNRGQGERSKENVTQAGERDRGQGTGRSGWWQGDKMGQKGQCCTMTDKIGGTLCPVVALA